MDCFGVGESQLLFDLPADGIGSRRGEIGRTMWNPFDRGLTAIEVGADWLTGFAAINIGLLAGHILHPAGSLRVPYPALASASFALATLIVLLFDREGAYQAGCGLLRIKDTERSLRVPAEALALMLPAAVLTHHMFLGRVLLIALLAAPALLMLEKQLLAMAFGALRTRGIGMRRVLIYGAGASGRRIYSALIQSPGLGLNPVAVVDDDAELEGRTLYASSYTRQAGIDVVAGPVTSDLIAHYRCELLLIAIPDLAEEKLSIASEAAQSAGVRLAVLSENAGIRAEKFEPAEIDGIRLNFVRAQSRDWLYEGTKRAFDFVCAVLLILVLAPVWGLIALLLRVDSPGPVLFRHERVGKDGRLFVLYKFRSMCCAAPRYGFSPRSSDDPRITRFGRFLRHTSLDELPQLLNVVKGEMALVGPRPEMEFIVREYGTLHRRRLGVLPGITGLWQLSADRAVQIHENIHYDLYYIQHRSFFMDCAILLHTGVFAMRGV